MGLKSMLESVRILQSTILWVRRYCCIFNELLSLTLMDTHVTVSLLFGFFLGYQSICEHCECPPYGQLQPTQQNRCCSCHLIFLLPLLQPPSILTVVNKNTHESGQLHAMWQYTWWGKQKHCGYLGNAYDLPHFWNVL